MLLTQQKWKQKNWTKYDKMTKIVKLGKGGVIGYVSLFFRFFMFVWNLSFKKYSFLMTHDFHNVSSHKWPILT